MLFPKDPPGFYLETTHKEYNTKDPLFFDKNDFPWALDLEANSDTIVKEIAPIFSDDFKGLQVNPEDRFQFPPKIWKGLPLFLYGFKFQNNLKQFPFLADKLSKIPNLVSANVSVLEPGAWLLPHNGATNGFMRCHFGLKIPATLPDCGFIIGGEEVSWEEGKILLFSDMNVHSAHNKTDKRRYILIMDVIRPEYLSMKKKICVHILSKFLTNVTADYMRAPFGVMPPRVNQDPTEKLEYVPNKGYKADEKLTIMQRVFRKVEDMMVPMYIAGFYLIFAFKKLQ